MVVVGAGRIGGSLARSARARGLELALVDRTSGWEHVEGPPGDPILLTVRTEDLAGVVERVPRNRRADLVVIQNGAIRGLLAELGLRDVTRGIAYVWAPSKDEDLRAAAWSPFAGPHAEEVARTLSALGWVAEAVDPVRFTIYELEKLLWLAVFGLLCEASGRTVGEVAAERVEEVDTLVGELLPVARAAWGLDPERAWVVERLLGWSRRIPEFRASVKELPWRNGWFADRARRAGLQTPLHDELVARHLSSRADGGGA